MGRQREMRKMRRDEQQYKYQSRTEFKAQIII